MTNSPLAVDEVLARRLFMMDVELDERWRQDYWQVVGTRALGVDRRHRLKHAAWAGGSGVAGGVATIFMA